MKQYRLFFTVTFLLLAISGHSQKLESGNVVGIWEFELTLEESMTFEQFEKLYIQEYIPAIKSNFPGTEIYLMKGERGKRTG
jgi:hypothetical protein